MRDASLYLREAAAIYDRCPELQANGEARAWRKGFSSGAEWMRLAMGELRGQPLPDSCGAFSWLGCAKYTLASLAGLIAVGLGWYVHPALAILSIPAFYAVEVQWVFLFPVAIDGSQQPWRDSRSLMRRHAGTIAAMSLVLPFAWRMLTGGFFGRGFVRSWCTGCLAVVLWYERCQVPILATDEIDEMPMLELGQRGPLFIRYETLSVKVSMPVRLLLITDIHARQWNGERLLDLIDEAIAMTQPNLIILGGDLADSAVGLLSLALLIRQWTKTAPVLAIPGNHDVWLGMERVKSTVVDAEAHWLPDAPYLHQRDGRDVLWVADVKQWGTPAAGISSVAVLHDPADYPKAKKHNASIVVAGHLHGCQVVFAEREGRLLPGAWFYRWNVLRHHDENGTLIVSRGCADTLPLRWNCPREVVVMDLVA